MTLKKQILTAGMWSLSTHVVSSGIRLATNLILARLLFPEAFGIVAVVTSIIVGITLITDFGVRAVIVRRDSRNEDEFIFSAWTFQLIRGFILWITTFLSCILLYMACEMGIIENSSIFGNKKLYIYIIISSIIIVLESAESANVHIAIKQMKVNIISKIEIYRNIFVMITIVLWTFLWPTIWPLIIVPVFGGLFATILSHTIVPGPTMRVNFNREHFSEITGIGKWIAVSSAATFFASQSDIIVLSIIGSATYLGVYYIAKSMMLTIESLAGRLVSTLLLSVLAKSTDDDDAVQTVKFYKFRHPIDMFCGFFGGFLFAFGNVIIALLYDARYEQAGFILEVLSVSLAIYPFQLIRNRFTLLGQTKVMAENTIVEAVSLIVFMFFGYLLGDLDGAIWGVALHRIVPSARILFISSRNNWVSYTIEIRIIAYFFTGYIAGKVALFTASEIVLLI